MTVYVSQAIPSKEINAFKVSNIIHFIFYFILFIAFLIANYLALYYNFSDNINDISISNNPNEMIIYQVKYTSNTKKTIYL